MKSSILRMFLCGHSQRLTAIVTHDPDPLLFKILMGAPNFGRFLKKASKWPAR